MTAELLRQYLEFSPQDPGPIAPLCAGQSVPGAGFVCATCCGRLAGRGVRLQGSTVVWQDRMDLPIACVVCDTLVPCKH